MRFTVLGSGTLLPDHRRHSAAHLVEAEDARLLLDCGFGTVHGFDRHRVGWRGLTHVALTHFHADHFADLAPLLFALRHGVRPEREDPLVILGPAGVRERVERLAAAYGDFVLDPGFPVEVVELSAPASWEDPGGRFRLSAHPTPHTDVSVAYRVDAEDGAAAGYTGDTGPSEKLGEFFAGVRLLVSECSLADPPSLDTHLSPAGVAELARAVSPDLLLLTHLYPPLRPHRVPKLVQGAGYAGRVLVAEDGTSVEVGEGRAELLDA